MTKPDDLTAVQTPSEAEAAVFAASMPRDTRFTPGTILLNRYRVISLLGRGGMGEVYRAEDMKLGQQVALKFVPRELASDPTILRHLYSEVRIGRDVAHPNVCRLYDIVEFEGDHFIAMQYVDGEDLASLLRRIGRLPVEKAIDIARDLCAGLAAAHDKGVIHRDLKPANVMIDGKGRAHITDFGLAVAMNDQQHRGIAGTPVYMAPEQLSGELVTPSSDLYALGLILYEIVSGKRMYDAASITQVAQQHLEPKPRLTSSVRDVPLPIDAIVMQCLEEDPASRPRSARHVLAALPGGDPLEAAIAAGETPSPEMVAASQKTGELPSHIAIGAVALFVAMLVGVAALAPRTTRFSSALLRKTPEALSDRAEEIVHAAGVTGDPIDHDGFFLADRDRLTFVYRRSSAPLSTNNAIMVVHADDPPLAYTKSANVRLASDGRLESLLLIPDESNHVASIDDLFRAAGFDRAQFHPVAPRMAPQGAGDQRMAWDGAAHIEAATYRGEVVWFDVNPRPAAPPSVTIAGVGGMVFTFMFVSTLALGIFLGVRNLRRGRTDLRGGLRAAIFILCTTFASLFLAAHWTLVSAGRHITDLLSQAAIDAVTFLVMYLGTEPYVRRYWPVPLISWQRLVDGQWRDSLVCRDAGIGFVLGIFSALQMRLLILLAHMGTPSTPPGFLASLGSATRALAWVLHVPAEGINYALGVTFGVLIGRVFIKRAWLYLPIFALMLAAAMSPKSGNSVIDAGIGMVNAIVVLYAIHRGGLLMVAASWSAYHVFQGLAFTLDFGAWYAGMGMFVAVALSVLAAFAFAQTVRRGRTLASVASTT